MADAADLPVTAHYLSHAVTRRFSPLVTDYLARPDTFKPFVAHPPDYNGIRDAIAARTRFPTDREGLYQELLRQYGAMPLPESVRLNLEKLRQTNCYTVCTAHQPALFTGALYFIYKIIHAARLADDLKTRFPEEDFVPVFYIGSEDNDLDELGHFQLGEEVFQWDGGGQQGAVGRMPTDSLQALLKTVLNRLGPPGAATDHLTELLQTAYAPGQTIASATRKLVTGLLGDYGIVVIDGDSLALKQKMIPVFADDLFEHKPYALVTAQSERLSERYPVQAYPRPVNLFYLDGDIRSRIEQTGADNWQVVGTDLHWNEQQLRDQLANHPETFSPNVVLRGLYQETILPNVAFIGGGAEVAYWMQLKPLFEAYEIPYPVVVVRQSIQWLPESATALLQATGLSLDQLFEDPQALLSTRAQQELPQTLAISALKEQIAAQLNPLFQLAAATDASLEAYGAAQQHRIGQLIEATGKKILQAEKRKHQIWYQRVLRLQQGLWLHKGLQERKLTFLDFYPALGSVFLQAIYDHTRPFGNDFLVLTSSTSSSGTS
ncbi:MAG: bacillithiol biosynthesis cysteine-adding enzyme BshC [Sphingobacteriales bacterium]|nr:MAG: bacillithiol biosynthesis cysteine-adding enzyme BshC [Sphingobacteriales bacterium]